MLRPYLESYQNHLLSVISVQFRLVHVNFIDMYYKNSINNNMLSNAIRKLSSFLVSLIFIFLPRQLLIGGYWFQIFSKGNQGYKRCKCNPYFHVQPTFLPIRHYFFLLFDTLIWGTIHNTCDIKLWHYKSALLCWTVTQVDIHSIFSSHIVLRCITPWPHD